MVLNGIQSPVACKITTMLEATLLKLLLKSAVASFHLSLHLNGFGRKTRNPCLNI